MKEKDWLLILGANSDIAIASAECFAQSGYNLFLASRDITESEKNANNIRIRYGVKVKSLFFDANDFQSHNKFFEDLEWDPFGILVSFGVMLDQMKSQKDFNSIKIMVETNYLGAMNILEIVASHFEKRKYGFIIGISSVAGDRGRMSNYIYGSTKGAFSIYLDGLGHRLSKSHVLVVNAKPGYVLTKMTKHLNLPKLLTANTKQVATSLKKAVQQRKSNIYILPIWRLIMFVIIHLPNRIFNKTQL